MLPGVLYSGCDSASGSRPLLCLSTSESFFARKAVRITYIIPSYFFSTFEKVITVCRDRQ